MAILPDPQPITDQQRAYRLWHSFVPRHHPRRHPQLDRGSMHAAWNMVTTVQDQLRDLIAQHPELVKELSMNLAGEQYTALDILELVARVLDTGMISPPEDAGE